MKLNVFCFAPICKLHTVNSVGISVDIAQGTKRLAKPQFNPTHQQQNKHFQNVTSEALLLYIRCMFLASPIVSQHLAERHNNAHSRNGRKTDSCGICLETFASFCDEWRSCVYCVIDGDLCPATSVDIFYLNAIFSQLDFFRAFPDCKLVEEGKNVKAAYLSESASGEKKFVI